MYKWTLVYQAFTLTTSILCLPPAASMATFVGIVAFGFSAGLPTPCPKGPSKGSPKTGLLLRSLN